MERDGSLNRWLGSLSPKTARDYEYTFKRYLDWLKENGGSFSEMSPDELVQYQRNSDNDSRYDVLDTIQSYIRTLDTRASSKERTYAVLKSFFLHNRVELPKDVSFRVRSEKPPVQGQLTLEELRDVIIRSKMVYQAIFASMFQGGMGVAEFEYWNLNGWDDLRKAMKNGDEVVKISLPGRKHARNKRPFYTFLGGDAVEKIRVWLNQRPNGVEAIFTNQYGDPIRGNAVKLYWTRHLRKLGFVEPLKDGYSGNRYGKNLHEIRDLFRTQWEKSPAKASVAEFMMGHVVDALNYNKAYMDEAWARREYEKALPKLQILSSGEPYGRVDVSEVERVRRELEEAKRGQGDEVKRLQATLEQRSKQMDSMEKMLNIVMRALSNPEAAPVLWKALKEIEEKAEG